MGWLTQQIPESKRTSVSSRVQGPARVRDQVPTPAKRRVQLPVRARVGMDANARWFNLTQQQCSLLSLSFSRPTSWDSKVLAAPRADLRASSKGGQTSLN
eukprot:1869578-Rhodomonas_salina.1